MKRLKTALLGLKGAGAEYLDALCGNDQFDLVAVGETDTLIQPDRPLDSSVRRYSDYRSLVVETASAGLDLLVVALKPNESFGFVTLAASHGVNVFQQAPFSRGVDDAREIVRLFAEHDAKYVVARPWEFDPALARLTSLDGIIGQVFAANAQVAARGDTGVDLLHEAYEVIDLLVRLLGRPESVFAQCAGAVRAHQARQAAVMVLRFADELVGSVSILGGTTDPSWSVTLSGSMATASVSPGSLCISCEEQGAAPGNAEDVSSLARALCAFGGELLSGVTEVKGAVKTHVSTVATIDAACLSGKTSAPEEPGRLVG